MIVRTLDECRNSGRRIVSDNWESTRMLLKDDNMGFSFHITTIYEATETHIHYQNHLESVFCMSGEGEIEVVGGKTYPIKPGTLYILDKNDEHYLRAYKNKEMTMACVFNPPITGAEVHDENGVYPLVD
ncbi:ectoine synthase [Vibrio splendidus]|uniref:L-ectoine synthase n=1 Tax=Vibrio splendidus 12E03 TaxID=1191305 RepID=A0A1E5FYC2_VIBSP|nr:ectoine synthase [Vibrio splendidus]OEF95394.1 L-ectoine synthase [Vibrio splendidus 12E03]